MFILIPFNNLNRVDELFQQEIFFKRFETEWNYTLLEARVENVGVIANFSASNQTIKIKSKILKVPKGVFLKTNKVVKYGPKSGISPFTIKFEYPETGKTRDYKVQMDWGRLIAK